MSLRLFCDRCKKESGAMFLVILDARKAETAREKVVLSTPPGGASFGHREPYLCGSCCSSLRSWLDNPSELDE